MHAPSVTALSTLRPVMTISAPASNAAATGNPPKYALTLASVSGGGQSAPENMSFLSAKLSRASSRSSPLITATFKSSPASAIKARAAAPHAAGLTPPALVRILTFFSAISRKLGFNTPVMKSVAKPASGLLARARAKIDMVISARKS